MSDDLKAAEDRAALLVRAAQEDRLGAIAVVRIATGERCLMLGTRNEVAVDGEKGVAFTPLAIVLGDRPSREYRPDGIEHKVVKSTLFELVELGIVPPEKKP